MPEQEVNVTSHGQSGGVTAHTVNISNDGQPPPRSKPRKLWKRLWFWALAALGVLASLVAVLEYFGIGPMELQMTDEKKTSVTSTNQSGGITAHTVNVGTVNVGQQPRRMNPTIAAEIQRMIPTGSKVNVVAVWGDQEAFAFAHEVKNWMSANGYPNVRGVDQAMYSNPIFGQQLKIEGGAYELIIGARQ